jgi:hypothetical protein
MCSSGRWLDPFQLENCTSSPQGLATEGATKTIEIGASGEEGDLRLARGGSGNSG